MLSRWKVISLVAVASVVFVGLVLVGLKWPELAVPLESSAVVVGTGFTAFAAYSAWKAAQVSRSATQDALRRERAQLAADLTRVQADDAKDQHWLQVESGYGSGSPRESALKANIAEHEVRRDNIQARIAELDAELS